MQVKALNSEFHPPFPCLCHREDTTPTALHCALLFLEMSSDQLLPCPHALLRGLQPRCVGGPVYSARILLLDTWPVHLGGQVPYKFKEPTNATRQRKPTGEWRWMSTCPKSPFICHWQGPQPLIRRLPGRRSPVVLSGLRDENEEKSIWT